MRNLTVALVKVFTPLGTKGSNLAMPKSAVTSRTNYAIGGQGERERGLDLVLSTYVLGPR